MLSSLISYSGTHEFFDEHYSQIEQLRQHFEDKIGGKIKTIGDLKNTLAWFGFEETAYKIEKELGLDIQAFFDSLKIIFLKYGFFYVL